MKEEAIKRNLRKLEQAHRTERKRHEARMTALNNQLIKLRLQCPHPASALQYEPDPSGNNDSFFTCTICGLEKKRF